MDSSTDPYSQFWENLFLDRNTSSQLELHAQAFPEPPLASSQNDAFPLDVFVDSLPQVEADFSSVWSADTGDFGSLDLNFIAQCPPDFLLGHSTGTGFVPGGLENILSMQEPDASAYPLQLDGATVPNFYQASCSETVPYPAKLEPVDFAIDFLGDPSQSALQRQTTPPKWRPSPPNGPDNKAGVVIKSTPHAHSPCVAESSKAGQRSMKRKREDSVCLDDGFEPLLRKVAPACHSDLVNNDAMQDVAEETPAAYHGFDMQTADWNHDYCAQLSMPQEVPTLDWAQFWQQFDQLDQTNDNSAHSEETRRTATPPKKRTRTTSPPISNLKRSGLAKPRLPQLSKMQFDCFTGPMVAQPRKGPLPHAHMGVLHVHRLRKPSSASSLDPTAPPLYNPSGVPYADLILNPSCPRLKQQQRAYGAGKLMIQRPSKSSTAQMFRCEDCGELCSRGGELARHRKKSCKMREIVEWIECVACRNMITARPDGFVRHLKKCKAVEGFEEDAS